jgi:chromosomal replication initiator protein
MHSFLKQTMAKNYESVWSNCVAIIKEKVGEQNFETWFKPIIPLCLVETSLTIQVPSQFFYEWLEENYANVLRQAISNELGVTGQLKYSIVIDKGNDVTQPKTVNLPTVNVQNGYHKAKKNNYQKFDKSIKQEYSLDSVFGGISQLNPNYTFDNYIEGDCNRLARSAGDAVANKPGITSFNPLMIYGGVGLGKTHLVQAIGNKIVENDFGKKVMYASSEKFANQVVDAFKRNSIDKFADNYLSVDVLIIDDVQFFSGKEKTQEIFFHIFNHLHQNGKQIIMTSDKSPKELNGLEERLVSRMKWGLTADIQQPEYETRMAIILKKLERDGIDNIPAEVIEYLAYSVETNVRELEGVVLRLIAESSLNRKDIDLDLAKQALSNIVQDIDVEVNIDYIQKYISTYFNVSIDLLKAKTRKREIVVARQVAMYIAKEYTNMSLKSIGCHFGNRDHSTVIHAISTVNDMMDTDIKFLSTMEDILKKVKMKAS